MDYNEIDLTPMKPGWGKVWQGGSVDNAIVDLPPPLVIVCMDRGEHNEDFISHHHTVEGVLSVWIDDAPDAILDDAVYLALIDAAIALLSGGMNLYVHCAAGVSRASYFDVGLHCRALKLSYQAAFDLVHAQRPVISPNSGFVAHLQRLEPKLLA